MENSKLTEQLLDIEEKAEKQRKASAEKQRALEEQKANTVAALGQQYREQGEIRALTLNAALDVVLSPNMTAPESLKAKNTVSVSIKVTDADTLDAINRQMASAYPNYVPREELLVTFNTNQLFLGRNNEAQIIQALNALSRLIRVEEQTFLESVAQNANTELPICLR